jgi:2-polyprenyl-3-methyl-5-hydroxy-6-metoxy-1,4-benzoquinol methylase
LPLEKVDLFNIDIEEPNTVKVKGYQCYDISSDKFVPYDNTVLKKRTWTSVKHKWSLLEPVLDSVNAKTYLDFGSNLGALVLASSLKDIRSTGIDYNEGYIHICRLIQHITGVQADFKQGTTKTLQGTWVDVLSAFSVWHHLYDRTEKNSIHTLVKAFMLHTNNLILEFPTEKDPKAIKWTKGDISYSRKILEDAIIENGHTYEILDESEVRPTYWIRK